MREKAVFICSYSVKSTKVMSTVLLILRLISWILLGLTMLYYLWIFFNVLVSLFINKKKFPEAEAKKAAVLICARNEENVIANIINSLNASDYPKDMFSIFVVAHNCTDRTADIARAKGATVFVRNNPEERKKGDALTYGIDCLLKEYPDEFDFITVLDADNEVAKDYLTEMNNALASSGADVVQGFYDSLNYYETWITELSSALWLQTMRCQCMPNSKLGLPCDVLGSGFAFKVSALGGEGWHTETITEDLEFTIQQVLAGHNVVAAPCAVFYSEQVTTLKPALVQRKRWAIGNTECFRRYSGKIIKAIPKRGKAAVKMLLDVLLYPALFATLVNLILQIILIPLSGGTPMGALRFIVITAIGSWLMVLPLSLILLIKEKKSLLDNMCTVMFFPLTLFVSMIMSCVSVFVRDIDWTPTVHKGEVIDIDE